MHRIAMCLAFCLEGREKVVYLFGFLIIKQRLTLLWRRPSLIHVGWKTYAVDAVRIV